jgi:IrrE N-terminal-like domain
VDTSATADYGPIELPSAPTRYSDPRAHELRAEYLATFGGDEIPAPVESIAEDLLGLRVEQCDLGECSGMLIPAERLILVNAAEATRGETPTRRHRFTIAHELGHWICHARGIDEAPTFCRAKDLSQDADRALEREANVFGAELLMPEAAVRDAWAAFPDATELAERFGVSALAAQWRLYSFGLGPKPD